MELFREMLREQKMANSEVVFLSKNTYLNGEPDTEPGGAITTRTNVSHIVVAVGLKLK